MAQLLVITIKFVKPLHFVYILTAYRIKLQIGFFRITDWILLVVMAEKPGEYVTPAKFNTSYVPFGWQKPKNGQVGILYTFGLSKHTYQCSLFG